MRHYRASLVRYRWFRGSLCLYETHTVFHCFGLNIILLGTTATGELSIRQRGRRFTRFHHRLVHW